MLWTASGATGETGKAGELKFLRSAIWWVVKVQFGQIHCCHPGCKFIARLFQVLWRWCFIKASRALRNVPLIPSSESSAGTVRKLKLRTCTGRNAGELSFV